MSAPGHPPDLSELLEQLRGLRAAMQRRQRREQHRLDAIAPAYRLSAANLLDYLVLREHDLRPLQEKLADCGLSSLGRCERQVRPRLEAVIRALEALLGHPPTVVTPCAPRADLLERHSLALLGSHQDRGIVMVTLPADAADDGGLIEQLLLAGMNVARINCAHDDPDCWRAMAERVRRTALALGRPCRIAMDLAGPKLRTGPLPARPGTVQLKPLRDALGRLQRPARVRLIPAPGSTTPAPDAPVAPAEEPALPLRDFRLAALQVGDVLVGRDASGRRRRLLVRAIEAGSALAETAQRCRFSEGCRLRRRGGGPRWEVGALPPAPGEVTVHRGDRLILTAAGASPCDEPGRLSISLPEVIADVAVGERVLFDDGKVAGIVRAATDDRLEVEVTHTRRSAVRLREDKGVNLPDSDLSTPALTARDRADLAHIAALSDIVNYSFVNRPEDVRALVTALGQLGEGDRAVILKIETRRAVAALPQLLLAAMERPAPLGVMIARGDLAIECGWVEMAELQEELLRLCEAAHVPCIWATQVLDEMAQHGMPTRAEITDAAMGARAEALMLNKGPNIAATVRTLHEIVRQAHAHQRKGTAIIRPLSLAGGWEEPERPPSPADDGEA